MPEPVALGIKPPPDALTSMGRMMEMSNMAQAMKARGIDIERAQGTLQADIDRARADSQRAQTEASVAARTAEPRVSEAQARAGTAGVEFEKAGWRFKADQADKMYELAGALIQDPSFAGTDSKAQVAALMGAEQRMRAYNIPEDQIRVHMGPMYMIAANHPDQTRNVLANVIRQGLGAGGQAQQGLVQAGSQQAVGNNPVTNMPQTTSRDQFGNVTGVTPTPTPAAAPAPGAAPGPGPGARIPQMQPGDPEAIPILTRERAAANQAAATVPQQHFNNQQIIKLAPISFTGTGAQKWADVFGTLQVPFNPGESESSNFQRMAHFMSLQSQANAAAMGAGTDAARAISEAATNKSGWTKDAIISTAKVNDALATGVDLYNRGMEKAIQASGGSVLAKRDFQNAWSRVFDVRAMQLHNALENGDRDEVAKIVKDAGGAKSAGAQSLLGKVRAMDKLVNDGRL